MKELHVPKPKLRLSAALTFAALLACLALAPVALAAPHVNLLDAEGDASEHRAITIGTEKSYHGELKGTDDSARSWSWAAEPAGLVSISGASSREASIKGVGEGTAEVTVTAELADGTRLSDSMLLTSYTWLPGAYPATAASGGAKLTRAATGDDARDYVRCTAPAGQEMEVVGTCGEGHFRVRLPEGFGFADPDGHTSNRNAFARRDSVVVPAASVKVAPASLKGREGSSASLTATVAPSFATDKTVRWSSSDPSVAKVDGKGEVSMVKAGSCTVTATCGPAKASASVEVQPPPVTVTSPRAVSRTAGSFKVRWSGADGAASYRVEVYSGRKWRTAKTSKRLGAASRTATVKAWYEKGASGKTEAVWKGSAYTFRVLPLDAKGKVLGLTKKGKPPSKDKGKVAAYMPPMPRAASRGERSVRIEWNAATCAASYRVQVKSGKSWKTAAAPVKNASGGTPSADVSALYAKGASGKTGKLPKSSALEFRVVPVNSDGEVIGKETSKDYQGSVGAYRLEVTLIDVGHGDCILVRTPENAFYLVDGGCNVAYRNSKSSKKVKSTYAETLDAIIGAMGNKRDLEGIVSTHPDYDHVDGLVRMLKDDARKAGSKAKAGVKKKTGGKEPAETPDYDRLSVRKLWYAKDAGKKKYKALLKWAKKRGAKALDASKKNRLVLDQGKDGVEVRLVHDKKDHKGAEGALTQANRDSALTLVRYKKFTMLLCADALGKAIDRNHGSKSVGKALGKMAKKLGKKKLTVDVLQVSHHGMVGTSGKAAARGQFLELLETCRPKALVVSTETRTVWRKGGVVHDYKDSVNELFGYIEGYESPPLGKSTEVYRTDKDGSVTVSSEGKSGKFEVGRAAPKGTKVTSLSRKGKRARAKNAYKGKRFGKNNRRMRKGEVLLWRK